MTKPSREELIQFLLALRLAAERKVDLRPLVSHEVKLEEIIELFRDLSEERLKAVKVLVKL